MAYVAEHIRRIRFPDARTVVWAHNYHIARGRILGDKVMGLHLKQAFKRKYKAIGIVALEAATDWPGVGCGSFATAEEGSVEELLSRLGEAYLLVDLSFPGGDPPYLAPGRRFNLNWGWSVVPKQRYNGLVYLESAEKMRPLAWRSCRP